jgi:hypothetical protein
MQRRRPAVRHYLTDLDFGVGDARTVFLPAASAESATPRQRLPQPSQNTENFIRISFSLVGSYRFLMIGFAIRPNGRR